MINVFDICNFVLFDFWIIAIMEVFLKSGIKVPNAVLVEGITETVGEEAIDFLKRYGSISKTHFISESESDFDGALLVEFTNSEALNALRPRLPYTLTTAKETICISELSTVSSEHFARAKTKSYLSDLKDLAKVTGVDFTDVLKSMMAQIGLSVTELQPKPVVKESPAHTESPASPQEPPPTELSDNTAPSRPAPELNTNPSAPTPHPGISSIDIHPPEVQRYVVEHIMKSEEGAVHHQRLRVFSGRTPRPPHESDYEAWRAGVDLMLRDPSVSDLQRSRRIVESLLPPAADMVKHLSHDTLPTVYMDTLDSAYGAVQDGDELYARFMDTFQDAGEKPSVYLQRLQVALNAALKRGGVLETDLNRHLLTQFCRGCWDNTLIAELQLKQKKSQPPTFAELLLLLRTEEDREAAKMVRMKQHLGAARPKASAHAQFVRPEPEDEGAVAALTTITQQLAQQIADVQRQLAMLTANQSKTTSSSKSPSYSRPPPVKQKATAPQPRRSAPAQPKPGYCFRCGEDGHIRPQCENEPNPALVAQKKKLFSRKQQNHSNNQLN